MVTIIRSGEVFVENPHDLWSWGYKTSDHKVEGWIPTLSHMVMIAQNSYVSEIPGILSLQEGDIIVAKAKRGDYYWGHKLGCKLKDKSTCGWFSTEQAGLQPADIE